MAISHYISESYRHFRKKWQEMADSAFSKASPAPREDMAGGEFISPFISEGDLSFPRAGDRHKRSH